MVYYADMTQMDKFSVYEVAVDVWSNTIAME